MYINLKELKRWVRDNYPPDHSLQVIQDEEDEIRSVEEHLAKVEIWLKLSRKEC